jgi:hypothetical protein
MRKQSSDGQHPGQMWPGEVMCAALGIFQKNLCSVI